MIKRLGKCIWDVMIDIGEARHEYLKRNGYRMWY